MSSSSPLCQDLPLQLSSFVDTFIDFSFSGLFFQNPNPNPKIQTQYPSPSRLVALGDLHGDLPKAKQALTLAGLINNSGQWTGGSTTLVQVGDILDRGGDEIKLLYFLHKLKQDSAKSGGSVQTLIGNHEVMNIESDFRFITPSALQEFTVWANWFQIGISMKNLCLGLERQKDLFVGIPKWFPGIRAEFQEGIRARVAALRPNGPISGRFLADNPTVLIVGDSVFVHGGLLQHHVVYGLDRINEEVKDWIKGLRGKLSPGFVRGRDAVVWLRTFSQESEKNCDCSMLEHVLATIPGAKRMIMGHTIQESGINGACENRAIRIDVGLSKGCGNGLPEVLEINGNSEGMRILTSNPLYQRRRFELEKNEGGKEGMALLLSEKGLKQVEVKA
ncbi:calcineurin-like metallo-phosphoesterase superfamily protein [Tasmannia lanceolata]|uniref:calcineurin-like metallo-phosphoesterase superfamily protein n=1 Tax=Tasmannia lanceolata TaxID=3420 RepID=UPI0040639958